MGTDRFELSFPAVIAAVAVTCLYGMAVFLGTPTTEHASLDPYAVAEGGTVVLWPAP